MNGLWTTYINLLILTATKQPSMITAVHSFNQNYWGHKYTYMFSNARYIQEHQACKILPPRDYMLLDKDKEKITQIIYKNLIGNVYKWKVCMGIKNFHSKIIFSISLKTQWSTFV